MIISSLQNVVFSHFISGKAVTSKCYAKHVSWKVFKNSLKRWRSAFPIMLQPLLLTGYSQGTWREFKQHLGTQKTVKDHSNSTETAFKGDSNTTQRKRRQSKKTQRNVEGYSKVSRRAHKGHKKDTWALKALKHLGTRSTQGTLFSRLLSFQLNRTSETAGGRNYFHAKNLSKNFC